MMGEDVVNLLNVIHRLLLVEFYQGLVLEVISSYFMILLEQCGELLFVLSIRARLVDLIEDFFRLVHPNPREKTEGRGWLFQSGFGLETREQLDDA